MPVRHQGAGIAEAPVLEAVGKGQIGACLPKGAVAALAEAGPEPFGRDVHAGQRLESTEAQGGAAGQKPRKA